MPDQYDPKVSPRPSADRRQADARRSATMADDPLAELAKIVQGRPTHGAAQPSRQAPAAPQSNGAAASDLEAELLNDLQASFAAVRDVLPPSPPPAARQPSPPPRAPVVVDEAPSVAAPAPQPAPPPPPRADAGGAGLRDEFRLEPVDQTRLVPIPPPPVIQPMIQTSAAPPPQPRPPVERPAMERKPEPPPQPEPPPVERSPVKPRQQPAATPDLGAFQLRGSAPPPAAAPPPPPARQPHSRWERPEPPRAQPAAASRFAPPRTAAPVMDDETADLDPFAEGGLFADQLEPPELEDEFPLDDLAALPDYGEDEHLPPLEDDLEALAPRRGISRNLVIVLGVVLVALVGGVGFAMFNGGSTSTGGAPPVIAADGNPTKITPDDTVAANDPDGQNKLIYDRVNSGDQTTADTTLLTPDNGPIKNVGSDTGNSAISRVIIPGGPGIDAPGADDALRIDQQPDAVPPSAAPSDSIGQVAANDAGEPVDPDAIQPIGPRKVRTVVVKPDGTIVSSAATDAGAAPDTAAPAATTGTAAAPPAPAVVDDTAAIAGNNSDALPITAPPADGTAAPLDTAPAAPAAVAVPPAAKPAAVKPAATKPAATSQQVATADDVSPIDIVPGATAPPATSGVLVQISSQRTEDAARATYRDLQARYPNILGSYDVNIQRADVPDRGTFYRVRVGPFSQNDAQRLCDDLRQAGGDCVLAKR